MLQNNFLYVVQNAKTLVIFLIFLTKFYTFFLTYTLFLEFNQGKEDIYCLFLVVKSLELINTKPQKRFS